MAVAKTQATMREFKRDMVESERNPMAYFSARIRQTHRRLAIVDCVQVTGRVR